MGACGCIGGGVECCWPGCIMTGVGLILGETISGGYLIIIGPPKPCIPMSLCCIPIILIAMFPYLEVRLDIGTPDEVAYLGEPLSCVVAN